MVGAGRSGLSGSYLLLDICCESAGRMFVWFEVKNAFFLISFHVRNPPGNKMIPLNLLISFFVVGSDSPG